MRFHEAIELVNQGLRVARKAWRETGWEVRRSCIQAPRSPHTLYKDGRESLPSWWPSETDQEADDWIIL
jgi:Protein of unknown function (DUF2829)